MARALVVQHTAHEGLGRLQEWLPAAGVDVHPIHPYLGHRIPPSVEGDALIVLGGPMSASDDEQVPWLAATRDLLATAIDDGVPTIGICLGAQLLAAAAGGEVRRGALGPELGLDVVTVSQPDLLLPPGDLTVVQWHFDAVVRLPESAALLASSSRYAAQAFRVGEVAWGLQFHFEATVEMVAEWARLDGGALAEEGRDGAEVVSAVAGAVGDLEATGLQITHRFAHVITG